MLGFNLWGRGLVARKCTPRKSGTVLEPCWNLLLLSWKNWINLFSALANLRHVFIFKRNFGLTILPNHGKRHFFLNILWHPKIGVGTCKQNMFFMQEHPKESCFRWPSFKHCKLVIKLNATDCDVPVTTFLTHPFNTPLLAGLSLLLLEFSRPKNIADYDVFARTWRRMSQFFVRLVWFLSSGCSCASEASGKFGSRRPISSGSPD